MSTRATCAAEDLVVEVCRRVADQPGDAQDLVGREVRLLAPLSSADEQRSIVDRAVARLNGLGQLDTWLHDPAIDEIIVNAGNDIWVDRDGRLEHVGTLVDERVEHLVERVLAPLGRRADRTSPIVDARLPDGARVCAVFPPVAVDGALLAIRRFSTTIRPLDTFTDAAGVALCEAAFSTGCNVVVSGATSSGKTSLVAALIDAFVDDDRLVVVEDTTELPITGRHAVRLEARPRLADGPPPVPLADLVRTALRLRPDRIVVGEVRGDEVLALVQAMNTGHDGSISTCHANSPLDTLLRLESLVLQAAPTWPLAAIRQQLVRSIDVIIHVARDSITRRRRIVSIAETVVTDHGGIPEVHRLAHADATGRLVAHHQLTRRRR